MSSPLVPLHRLNPLLLPNLHIRIKLLLAALGAESLALEGAKSHEAFVGLTHEGLALSQKLNQARFLDLLLEALLQAVIGLFAFLVGMDSHGLVESKGCPSVSQDEACFRREFPNSKSQAPNKLKICSYYNWNLSEFCNL